MNIGSEPGKGRELEKETFNLLQNDPHINFYGNLEGKDIFSTPCDILLTDGFTGNMVMKTCEGVVKQLVLSLKRKSIIQLVK